MGFGGGGGWVRSSGSSSFVSSWPSAAVLPGRGCWFESIIPAACGTVRTPCWTRERRSAERAFIVWIHPLGDVIASGPGPATQILDKITMNAL